jgi:hypothetical protein
MPRNLCLLLILGVGLAGCDGRRVVTPTSPAAQFEEQLAANRGDLPAYVNNPPDVSRSAVMGRRPAPRIEVEPSAIKTAASLRPNDPLTEDYSQASVITVSGPVVGYQYMPLSHDRTGLFVKVKVGGEFPMVYLGPQGWLTQKDFDPQITHMIEVTGSRVRSTDGQDVIIAREAVWSDRTLAIRETDGTPLYPVPTTSE